MNTQSWKFIVLVAIFATIAVLIPNGVTATDPEPPAGATQVREADGAVMVYVPAGEFLMGSPEGEGYSDEWPQHTVYLDGFWIDRTEVTNRQFEIFVKTTGYRTGAENEGTGGVHSTAKYPGIVPGADWRHPEGPESSIAGRQDEPVVQVTWHDADAYCQWADGRLPTEAEWEKAACGTDDRRYPWGDNDPTCQNVIMGLCGHGPKPLPVGSKPDGVSPYGGLDMFGNAAEWVFDSYARDYYGRSEASNPFGPDTGMDKVLRGDVWDPGAEQSNIMDLLGGSSCSSRLSRTTGFRMNTAGFRCVVPTAASAVPSPAKIAAPVSPPPVVTASAMPVQIGQHGYMFEWRGDRIDYFLTLPEEYVNEGQKMWPLILLLHSGGESPTLDSLNQWNFKLRSILVRVGNTPDFPFIVLSPLLPADTVNWYAALDMIDALLDQIVVSYRVDVARLSVMGYSRGGEGAWLMATRKRLDRFAAVVSMTGLYVYYLDKSNACIPKDVAFWLSHGSQDDVVPVSNTEALVNALKACGTEVRYTVLDAGYRGAEQAVKDPTLYDWLLKQTRQDK